MREFRVGQRGGCLRHGICRCFSDRYISSGVGERSRQADPSRGRAGQELERVRAEPLALRDFLKRMPKGADLHSHLSGAVYAETHISDAIQDGLCVDTDTKAFAKSQPVVAGVSCRQPASLRPTIFSMRSSSSAAPIPATLASGLTRSPLAPPARTSNISS